MRKQITTGIILAVFLCSPAFAAAIATQPSTYSDTLLQSAFQQADADNAVVILLDAKAPIPEIVNAAMQNGVSADDIVGALLAAGVSPQKIVRDCLQGPMPFKSVLLALDKHGFPPEDVLTKLIEWDLGIEGLYDTCAFMLEKGFSKEDILRKLKDAGADREIVVQVVRWFEIPPATVVAVYQTLLDYFGHVFNRDALPQPALLAIGVTRIAIVDKCCRPIISPMRP